jgi:uncharacterized protein YybS (DUF2232 family)
VERGLNVADQGYYQPEIRNILLNVLLISLVLVLPGLQWSLFGWLYMFLPLYVLYLLSKFGVFAGRRMLLTAAAISLCINLFLGSFDLFLFSAVMLIPGVVLYQSLKNQESPPLSGLKGYLSLAGGWLLAVVIGSAGSEMNVYSQMLLALDQGLAESLELYRQSDGVSGETLTVIESTISQMKIVIPAVMPGIIGSVMLLIIWATMALGNIVLEKTCGQAAWSSFHLWALPEKLIWAVIAMGAMVLIPLGLLPKIGINCILLLFLLYCFQGLSIIVFFMNKWNVPLLLRSFIYVMIVLQSLGTLVLLFFGIADIWMDFRKLKAPAASINK